jgi:hypothetical protein
LRQARYNMRSAHVARMLSLRQTRRWRDREQSELRESQKVQWENHREFWRQGLA